MTLDQHHELRLWHLRHARQRPVEKNLWDTVLTLWLIGWVGGPVVLVLGWPWVEPACLAMIFLPGLYVALRRHWHRRGRLRCDWAVVLG